MKAIVLGYGSIGKRHAENLFGMGIETAVYDPGVPEHANLDWEQQAEGQMVFVCSPTKFHAGQTLAAIHAGAKAVYVEKPPAVTAEAWRDVVAVGEKAHVKIAVGYNWRFYIGAENLRVVQDQITEIQITAIDDVFDWPTFGPQSYAVDKQGGGVLLTSASHGLDLLVHLFGPGKVKRALVSRGAHAFQGVDAAMIAEIEHEKCNSRIVVAWAGPPCLSSVLARFSSGQGFYVDFMHESWKQEREHGMHLACLKAFVDWADDGEPGLLCTGEQATHSMDLIEQCRVLSS